MTRPLVDADSAARVGQAPRFVSAVALAEASVVASFSDYEAHPVAVMEALSVGRPVVGYASSGIGELVNEGLVFGVRPGSAAADAAESLVQMMTAQEARPVTNLPTWDKTAAQLAATYRTLLRRGQSHDRRASLCMYCT